MGVSSRLAEWIPPPAQYNGAMFNRGPTAAQSSKRLSVEIVGGADARSATTAQVCAQYLRAQGHGVVSYEHGGTRHRGVIAARARNRFRVRRRPDLRLWVLGPRSRQTANRGDLPASVSGTLNAACWTWDLQCVPARWLRLLQHMDTVLVPSTYAGNALAGMIDARVDVAVPLISPPLESQDMRCPLGISPEDFLVSTVVDLGSSITRQNPFGAIDAFDRAFGADQDAWLVVKLDGRNESGTDLTRLYRAAAANSRIVVVSANWRTEQLHGLLRGSDAYVSLHRSDSFGVNVAQAAVNEVPTVVTNWSGNMDYCSTDTFLVNSRIVPIVDDHWSLKGSVGGVWAEPDTAHAAQQLQLVRADRLAARRRAADAANVLKAHLEQKSYKVALDRLMKSVASAPDVACRRDTEMSA